MCKVCLSWDVSIIIYFRELRVLQIWFCKWNNTFRADSNHGKSNIITYSPTKSRINGCLLFLSSLWIFDQTYSAVKHIVVIVVCCSLIICWNLTSGLEHCASQRVSVRSSDCILRLNCLPTVFKYSLDCFNIQNNAKKMQVKTNSNHYLLWPPFTFKTASIILGTLSCSFIRKPPDRLENLPEFFCRL